MRRARACFNAIQQVQGTLERMNIPPHYMGINFRCLDIRMPHEFLEHPDIDSIFQHVGGKGMTKGVNRCPLVYPGFPYRRLDSLLQP